MLTLSQLVWPISDVRTFSTSGVVDYRGDRTFASGVLERSLVESAGLLVCDELLTIDG